MGAAAPSSSHRGTRGERRELASRRWGWASVTCALISLVGFGWTWSYSATDFDPVPVLRIPLLLMLPLGLVAAALCAVLAWAGPGRPLAWTGLGISALVVAAFVVLLTVTG